MAKSQRVCSENLRSGPTVVSDEVVDLSLTPDLLTQSSVSSPFDKSRDDTQTSILGLR